MPPKVEDGTEPMPKTLVALTLAVAALAAPALAQTPRTGPTVVTSPQPLPIDAPRPRVFLGGSIDMGGAPDWQAAMTSALSDMDVTILNPRRPDWNPDWRPEADEPEFRRQVEWELAALESADVIVMYFAPGTQSPISLLEMGLHARGGKLVVLAPEGFWRKGNVDITAQAYGVRQVRTMAELTAAVRERLAKAATEGRFAR
ncbi:hypothetical protein ABIE19_001155 [Brevundimonas faecalis]|uniref:Nucleoside 2-deoxyribosyltransferase n=2 Tax=Brevundimonas faecalis TaxID=947378 RepID=A0ABV2R9I4_9CAUL